MSGVADDHLTFTSVRLTGAWQRFLDQPTPCENCGTKVIVTADTEWCAQLSPGLWEVTDMDNWEIRLIPHTPESCRMDRAGWSTQAGNIKVRRLTEAEYAEMLACTEWADNV